MIISLSNCFTFTDGQNIIQKRFQPSMFIQYNNRNLKKLYEKKIPAMKYNHDQY